MSDQRRDEVMHGTAAFTQRFLENTLQETGTRLVVVLIVQPATQGVERAKVYFQRTTAMMTPYYRCCCTMSVNGVDDAVRSPMPLDLVSSRDDVFLCVQQRCPAHPRPGRAVVPGDGEMPPSVTQGRALGRWREGAVVVSPE